MSQKIALIQPRIDAGKSLGIKKAPESIQSLAGQLKKGGFDVQMFHSAADYELKQKLKKFNPDLVGISTMTPNFPEGKRIAEGIKAIRDDILIVLGGWHASGCVQAHELGQESESLMEILNSKSPFDYAVIGEGELVLSEIARKNEAQEGGIEELPGVVSFDGEKIRINTAGRIKNLDILEDPSWEGLNIDEYRDQRTGFLDLSVHFNRACRFRCGFCSTATVYGKGVSTFSPGRAVDYIEDLVSKNRPEVITFTDEDFFAKISWVEEVVNILEERDLHGKYGVEFDTFASIPDIVKLKREGRGDLLKRMKKVGFNSFTIGIESLNANTLKAYNKEPMVLLTMTREQRDLYEKAPQQEKDKMLENQQFEGAQEAINFAREHGILVVGDYIIGNLGESEKQVVSAFQRFSKLRNLHLAYIPTYTPFPGTKLWKEAYDSGRIARTFEEGVDWARFDASKGAMDLEYDVGELRDELELIFYTSERYREDMMVELKRRPELIALFKSRFKYLENKFGKNNLLTKRLKKLESRWTMWWIRFYNFSKTLISRATT